MKPLFRNMMEPLQLTMLLRYQSQLERSADELFLKNSNLKKQITSGNRTNHKRSVVHKTRWCQVFLADKRP